MICEDQVRTGYRYVDELIAVVAEQALGLHDTRGSDRRSVPGKAWETNASHMLWLTLSASGADLFAGAAA